VTLDLSPGAKAWIGLAGYVIVRDAILIYREEKTMSAVFGEALNDPSRKWPVLVAWGFLTLHLHREVLPSIVAKLDPLGNGHKLLVKVWYNHSGDTKSESN